ncbi:MAG TPA: hypothetical protein VEH30_06700 [Terriglobales bacterium]|nr:hypothetical protein [Terriglobales bacterium]
MRYLRYLALLSFLILPVLSAHAGVTAGVAVGPPYLGPTPVCASGYYGHYPYACAPRGYYAPNWFVGGVFIGAGPWYRSYYGPGVYRPRFYGPRWYGGGWSGPHVYARGWYGYHAGSVRFHR